MAALQTLQTKLSSVEELSSALAPSGWAVDFCQLEQGAGPVMMDVVGASRHILMKIGLDSLVHQQAVPPPGLVTFALPIESHIPFKLGGRVLSTDTLTCFDPDNGINGVSERGFRAYTLSFDADRISDIARTAGLEDPNISTGAGSIPRQINGAATDKLRKTTESIFLHARQCDPSAGENLRRLIESELPLEILRLWSTGSRVPESNYNNRSRALRRAMDYINANAQASISVEELCRNSACSMSTLERAFREYFGASPKQYLTALRLSGVRTSLLNPGETRNISDLATEWGFWHMSKFASDYKRMFGELPSETRYAA